jgi:hypothetical protein
MVTSSGTELEELSTAMTCFKIAVDYVEMGLILFVSIVIVDISDTNAIFCRCETSPNLINNEGTRSR